eukprot:1182009-Prorocentrum_minimum.AAC.4
MSGCAPDRPRRLRGVSTPPSTPPPRVAPLATARATRLIARATPVANSVATVQALEDVEMGVAGPNAAAGAAARAQEVGRPAEGHGHKKLGAGMEDKARDRVKTAETRGAAFAVNIDKINSEAMIAAAGMTLQKPPPAEYFKVRGRGGTRAVTVGRRFPAERCLFICCHALYTSERSGRFG